MSFRKCWLLAVLLALASGLTTQFVWKLVYFPEPVILIVSELIFIWLLTIGAVWATIRL